MRLDKAIAPRWIAYRTQGFGGLRVPEEIRFDERGEMWTPQWDGMYGSRIERDGPLFDTREECEAACEAMNREKSR